MPETTLQNWRQIWNSGASTFTSLLLEITDTDSGSTSRLLDLKVNGDSRIAAEKSGRLLVKSVQVDDGLLIASDGSITITGYGTTFYANDGAITGVGQLEAAEVTAGTLALSGSVLANRVLASPDGSNGAPTFRPLAVGDLPASSKTLVVARSAGTVSATATFRLPPMPGHAAKVTAARLVVGDYLSASDSSYWTFRIRNKGTDGGDNT